MASLPCSADVGHAVESEQSSQRALAIFEKLYRDDPSNPRIKVGLAEAEFHHFLTLTSRGRWPEAETSIRCVLSLWETVNREPLRNASDRAELAKAHLHYGNLLRATDRPSEAADSFRHASQMYDQLVAELGYRTDCRRARPTRM